MKQTKEKRERHLNKKVYEKNNCFGIIKYCFLLTYGKIILNYKIKVIETSFLKTAFFS